MFNAMMEAFMEEVVGFLFNLEVKVQEPGLIPDASGRAVPMSAEVLEELIASGPDADALGSLPGAVNTVDESDESEDSEPEQPAAAQAKARPVVKAKGIGERKPTAVSYSAPSETGEAVKSADASDDPYAGVGRNAPCPCGSGKKFKLCHGRRG